jgi:hypothetical protein
MVWMMRYTTSGVGPMLFNLRETKHFEYDTDSIGRFLRGREPPHLDTMVQTAAQSDRSTAKWSDAHQLNGGSQDIIVHPRFKEFLETIDPGYHRFHPIELFRKNKDHMGTGYVWVCDADVDCILTNRLNPKRWNEESGLDLSIVYRSMQRGFVDGEFDATSGLRVSKPAIAGHHVWRAGMLGFNNNVTMAHVILFVSDEFYKAFKKQKYNGFDFMGPFPEDDVPWIAEDNMAHQYDAWRERHENMKAWKK